MKHSKETISRDELARLEALVNQKSPKRPASVSVSGSLLEATDRLAGATQRSAFIERALRKHLRRLLRAERNARELALLNANADRLNAESDEIIADQASPADE